MSIKEKIYLKSLNFKRKLNDLSEELKGKKVLIYGAGILFETAYKNYDFSKINIIGISDKKFENNNCANSFYGITIYPPDTIGALDVDCILVATKAHDSIINFLSNRYKKIVIRPLFIKYYSTFFRRNISQNIFVEFNGPHGKKCKSYSSLRMKMYELYARNLLKFNKIDIPQIEFNITTHCSLKCKHCVAYIPRLDSNEHCIITLDEFKIQLDNLLRAVNKVKNLIIIGGEPLLVNNIHEYIDYAASKKQVERVYIVTNGTIIPKEATISIAKKYKNKFAFWLSNYTKNEALASRLKNDKILEVFNIENIDYDYVIDTTWTYTSPLNVNKQRDDYGIYFSVCGNVCVAVFGGKIFVCPRAGVFYLKNIYTPEEEELINLNIEHNPKILYKKLVNFYSRKTFTSCNYCSYNEDVKRESILPAIQIEY